MHRWMWLLGPLTIICSLVGCRPRTADETNQNPGPSADPSSTTRAPCPPLDAVFVPLTEVRADVLQRVPAESPERWRELATVDAAAARALANATLPPELDAASVSRLSSVLDQMNAISTELATIYDARADANKAQDALKTRIDTHSTALQARCNDNAALAEGCKWSGSMPSDPDGNDPASLRAFVQSGRTLSTQDAQANTAWSALLDALADRATAIETELARDAAIQDAAGRLQTLDEEEVALLGALASACPQGLPHVGFTTEIPRPQSRNGDAPPAPDGGNGNLPPPPGGGNGNLPPAPDGGNGGNLPPAQEGGGNLPPAQEGGGNLPPAQEGPGGLPPLPPGGAPPSPPPSP